MALKCVAIDSISFSSKHYCQQDSNGVQCQFIDYPTNARSSIPRGGLVLTDSWKHEE